MLIRKAEVKDLKFIQELNNQLFDLEIENYDPYLTKNWPLSDDGKDYFLNAIKENCVLVAESENKVVGYLLAEEIDIPYYKFKLAELCNMCVNKQYRRQGIGEKLFLEFEKYFQDKGITHFTVTASFKNESAKSFYKKMGFVEANSSFVKF